ncbi:MAG: methyl-accepting chemotaxis protein [gamma proteobacterium symbiont of Taylorina sp.]|nr:methyl-accepting chemotaxis protein [gamma proteobacterium symbiont of Taylorina sp.]
MNWLSNISIRSRLWLLTSILIIIMIVISVFGMLANKDLNNHLVEMYEDPLSHTKNVGRAISALKETRVEALLSFQHDSKGSFAKLHDHEVDVHLNRIQKSISELKMNFKHISEAVIETQEDGSEAQYVQKINDKIEVYLRQGLQPVIDKLTQRQFYEANQLFLKNLNSNGDSYFGSLIIMLEGFVDFNDDEAQELFVLSEENYQATLKIEIVLTAIGFIIGFGLSWLIIRNIDRVVKELYDVATEFADGNLARKITYNSHDELGRVSQAFNQMGEQFRELLSEISDSVRHLASASDKTSSVTLQTQQGLRNQQDKTDDVASAMHEMTASMSEVKNNAHQAAEAAKRCESEANQGMGVVSDTITTIRAVSTEVESAVSNIHTLEQDTEKMGSILDVIKGIAEQTNLLALNAAIEAARAGEQGRGFAVVADEVRTLASRTQESTQEIHEMIESLRSGTQNAVTIMNRSKEQAELSVTQSNKADESLKSINSAVNTILEMNTHIASSVEEQTSVADNINENIVSINQVAEESVAGADQMASSSEELARLANHLKTLVGRFQV